MAACLPRSCTNDVLKTSWTVALARAFEQGMIVPLRVELKPFERIVIGDLVLINSGTRTSFRWPPDAGRSISVCFQAFCDGRRTPA
jgi:hypothetical protein